MKTRISTTATILLCATASLTHADEILFNNGDRITGTVVSADGGKITFKTAVVGEIKVDVKDVKSFTSDTPVELKMADGAVIKDKLVPTTQPGTIQTAGSGSIAAQPVALTDVKKINPPPVAWTGSIRAGALMNRGNTHDNNFNFGADATRRTEDTRITLGAGYFLGNEKTEGQSQKTTTDNWFAQGKYDYFFAPKWYAYGNLRVEHDNIADLDLRLTPGVGLGYQWIESPDFNFNTEGGLSYVYEEYSSGGSEEHIAARLAYHVDKKLNERVSLFHNLEYLPSVEDLNDFNITADAGMRVSLTKRMFSEAKVEWRHDQTPAAGKGKDDTRYIISLGWAF